MFDYSNSFIITLNGININVNLCGQGGITRAFSTTCMIK